MYHELQIFPHFLRNDVGDSSSMAHDLCMSFPARITQRGASVLAALVFVAILSVVAVGISSLKGDQSQRSQTASVGGTLAAEFFEGAREPVKTADPVAQAKKENSNLKIPDCSTIESNKEKPFVATVETQNKGQECTCKKEDKTKTPAQITYRQIEYRVTAKNEKGKVEAITKRSVGQEVNKDADTKCAVFQCSAWNNKCSPRSVDPESLYSTLAESGGDAVKGWTQDTKDALKDPSLRDGVMKNINNQITGSQLDALKDAWATEKKCTYTGSGEGSDVQYTENCSLVVNNKSPGAVDTLKQLDSLAVCGKETCPSAGPVSCNQPGANSATCIPSGEEAIKLNPGTQTSPGDETSKPYVDCSKDDCIAVANSKSQMEALKNKGFTCDENGEDGTYACYMDSNTTCPTGFTGKPPECTKSNTPPGCQGANCSGPGTITTTHEETTKTGNTTGFGGGMGNLGSMLSALGRGLMSSALSPSATCTSDQSTYQSQLQQYQTQMQMYQQQMQQYNYYQYQMQNSGNSNGYMMAMPTMPSQPCYNANASCTSSQPSQPDASGCTAGTWKPLYTGSCITNWQCVPGTGTGVQPTAKISCQPQIADVGMSIAITYACTNATASRGGGFDSLSQASGSATAVIQTPPSGTNTATYSIMCINGSLTTSDQCAIQVGKPTIALAAVPQSVASGDISSIGWVTTGMQACTLSSPQQADFTTANASNQSVNGMATSSPITASTDFVLTCTTVGGATKVASTTVTLK